MIVKLIEKPPQKQKEDTCWLSARGTVFFVDPGWGVYIHVFIFWRFVRQISFEFNLISKATRRESMNTLNPLPRPQLVSPVLKHIASQSIVIIYL